MVFWVPLAVFWVLCCGWWSNFHNKQRPQPHEIIELPFSYKLNAREKIVEFYNSGLSLRAIAKRGAMSKTKIRKTLEDAGVELRNFRKNQPKKPDLTQNMRSGNTPYGYCYLEGKLVMDAREYQVVLDIWRMWQEKKSLRAIAKILNYQETPTRFGKTWKHEVIKQVIIRHEEGLKAQ